MNQYLTPEQRSRFEQQLAGETLTDEQKLAAFRQGQDMARAGSLRDLEALLPEIAEYILAHPEYSIEEDGLERAYNAVRAAKYRSDEELLGDPESVKRLASDPRVKNAVLVAHLAETYRAGRDLPAFISGGGVPAAADVPADGMRQARAKLEALLKN